MSTEKLGNEHMYVFEFKVERLSINVSDATDGYSKSLAAEFNAGCVSNLTSNKDLILTETDHANCLKTEHIKSIYTTNDRTRSFGFAFPSRKRAWASTPEEPVSAGFSTDDFKVYREYLLQ